MFEFFKKKKEQFIIKDSILEMKKQELEKVISNIMKADLKWDVVYNLGISCFTCSYTKNDKEYFVVVMSDELRVYFSGNMIYAMSKFKQIKKLYEHAKLDHEKWCDEQIKILLGE